MIDRALIADTKKTLEKALNLNEKTLEENLKEIKAKLETLDQQSRTIFTVLFLNITYTYDYFEPGLVSDAKHLTSIAQNVGYLVYALSREKMAKYKWFIDFVKSFIIGPSIQLRELERFNKTFREFEH